MNTLRGKMKSWTISSLLVSHKLRAVRSSALDFCTPSTSGYAVLQNALRLPPDLGLARCWIVAVLCLGTADQCFLHAAIAGKEVAGYRIIEVHSKCFWGSQTSTVSVLQTQSKDVPIPKGWKITQEMSENRCSQAMQGTWREGWIITGSMLSILLLSSSELSSVSLHLSALDTELMPEIDKSSRFVGFSL